VTSKTILYVVNAKVPEEIRAEKICSALANMGNRVIIACKWSGEDLIRETKQGYLVCRIGKDKRLATCFPGNPIWTNAINDLVHDFKPDIIICIIGEGASGGALGIGIGDRVLMLENAWYSVIAPESCSSILWRSWDFKEQAAEALKLTAPDLQQFGIIDRIVPEPTGGAHRAPIDMFETLKNIFVEELKKLMSKDLETLVHERREKFAGMGVWTES
jgi:hypothetical protein